MYDVKDIIHLFLLDFKWQQKQKCVEKFILRKFTHIVVQNMFFKDFLVSNRSTNGDWSNIFLVMY